jgi:hypothetical protein
MIGTGCDGVSRHVVEAFGGEAGLHALDGLPDDGVDIGDLAGKRVLPPRKLPDAATLTVANPEVGAARCLADA